jgi:hypothetical protein
MPRHRQTKTTSVPECWGLGARQSCLDQPWHKQTELPMCLTGSAQATLAGPTRCRPDDFPHIRIRAAGHSKACESLQTWKWERRYFLSRLRGQPKHEQQALPLCQMDLGSPCSPAAQEKLLAHSLYLIGPWQCYNFYCLAGPSASSTWCPCAQWTLAMLLALQPGPQLSIQPVYQHGPWQCQTSVCLGIQKARSSTYFRQHGQLRHRQIALPKCPNGAWQCQGTGRQTTYVPDCWGLGQGRCVP